jgi:hypothetical protein
MIETGCVISTSDDVLYWHEPPARTDGSLPDSSRLWQVLWDVFKDGTLLGFAHSHPGNGVPGPSYTDVTTFAAIEAALGTRIYWWITSDTHVVRLEWEGPGKLTYTSTIVDEAPSWVDELRRLSQQGQQGQDR